MGGSWGESGIVALRMGRSTSNGLGGSLDGVSRASDAETWGSKISDFAEEEAEEAVGIEIRFGRRYGAFDFRSLFLDGGAGVPFSDSWYGWR